MNGGDVVDQRWELQQKLGQGRVGPLWSATATATGGPVVLELFPPGRLREVEALERALRSPKSGKALRWAESTLNVLEVLREEDQPSGLVLEPFDGEPVLEQLERDGPLATERATDLVIQACRVLSEAHRRGVSHHGLAPSDIFVTPRGLKLLSMATLIDGDDRRLMALGVPSPESAYAAPELVMAAPTIDHRADVYTAGATLYHLLTGHPPFVERDERERMLRITRGRFPLPRSHRPDLDRELEQLLLRAMARRPGQRFGSMLELAEALAPFGSGDLKAPPPDIAPAPPKVVVACSPTLIRGQITDAQREPSIEVEIDTPPEVELDTPEWPSPWARLLDRLGAALGDRRRLGLILLGIGLLLLVIAMVNGLVRCAGGCEAEPSGISDRCFQRVFRGDRAPTAGEEPFVTAGEEPFVTAVSCTLPRG